MAWFTRRRRPVDRELNSEIRFHIEKLIEEKLATGLTAEEARREATVEFGGREQIKEELRDVQRFATVENAATYMTVPLIILSVATVASLLPALRAARVEPMQVLREE